MSVTQLTNIPTEAPISTHDLAECLMSAAIGKVHPDTWRTMVNDIETAIDTAVTNERERCAGIEFATARNMGSFAVVEVGNLGIKLYQDIDDATALAESINLQIQCAIREGKS